MSDTLAVAGIAVATVSFAVPVVRAISGRLLESMDREARSLEQMQRHARALRKHTLALEHAQVALDAKRIELQLKHLSALADSRSELQRSLLLGLVDREPAGDADDAAAYLLLEELERAVDLPEQIQ